MPLPTPIAKRSTLRPNQLTISAHWPKRGSRLRPGSVSFCALRGEFGGNRWEPAAGLAASAAQAARDGCDLA
jgi:hypothetical protein